MCALSNKEEIPALLRFHKGIDAVSYPEEGITIVKDDKGIDALDKNFRYVNYNKLELNHCNY